VVQMWMAEDDFDQTRVIAAGEPGDTGKRDVLTVQDREGPAHVHDEALPGGLQLDARAPDLGHSPVNSGPHGRAGSLRLDHRRTSSHLVSPPTSRPQSGPATSRPGVLRGARPPALAGSGRSGLCTRRISPRRGIRPAIR
jgi:hypothetical protein